MRKIKFIFLFSLVAALCICSACNRVEYKTEVLDTLPIGISWYMEKGQQPFYAEKAEDLLEGNPWTTLDSIQTLPVYLNTFYKGGEGYLKNMMTVDDAASRAKSVAKALGIAADSIETPDSMDSLSAGDKPRVYAVNESVEISVSLVNDVTILYTPPLTLPKRYRLNVYSKQASEEALGWLAEIYSPVLGIEEFAYFAKPAHSEVFGPYYELHGYEKTGDIVTDILNYNFASVTFEPLPVPMPDSGGITLGDRLISVTSNGGVDALSKKGDYPIININQARDLLFSGKYYSCAEFSPEVDRVACVELAYNTDVSASEYFMPYYRFFITAPETLQTITPSELTEYYAFYVPAIEAQYLDFSE